MNSNNKIRRGNREGVWGWGRGGEGREGGVEAGL